MLRYIVHFLSLTFFRTSFSSKQWPDEYSLPNNLTVFSKVVDFLPLPSKTRLHHGLKSKSSLQSPLQESKLQTEFPWQQVSNKCYRNLSDFSSKWCSFSGKCCEKGEKKPVNLCQLDKVYVQIRFRVSEHQIPSKRMISLIPNWFAISKLVRHFSVSSKLRKLQIIRPKRLIQGSPDNTVSISTVPGLTQIFWSWVLERSLERKKKVPPISKIRWFPSCTVCCLTFLHIQPFLQIQ